MLKRDNTENIFLAPNFPRQGWQVSNKGPPSGTVTEYLTN
jgi:hypothetical protein